jgi:simple sugar transport system ATP-binding protein
MVHQHFMLVDTMSVAENIILGAEPGSGLALDIASARSRIRSLSETFGLAVDPEAMVGQLSVGQQQRVELLKALYREARILILDEPTAVLAPQEVEGLFGILRRMREEGKTVVIITHKLSEVLAISDEVTVMRDGRVIGSVATKSTSAAELARMMVGREVLLRVDKPAATPGEVVLRVRSEAVNFDVRAREIVGIAGVEGNGQTELVEWLAGLRPQPGSVELLGREIGASSARKRRELGIAHVPEDRHRRGLILDFDLADNVLLGAHDRRTILDRDEIESGTKRILAAFDVRPPDPDLPARSLSGGNQQKLILGRELDRAPKLLLIAQPTRGVDIGAIEFIHRKLVSLRDSGCAILLVSSELEEVTALADRLLVMHNGAIAGEVDPLATSAEEIGLMMTGGR